MTEALGEKMTMDLEGNQYYVFEALIKPLPSDYDLSLNQGCMQTITVIDYVKSMTTVHACVAGLHTNSEIPHIHMHFIVDHIEGKGTKTFFTNRTIHKSRFLSEDASRTLENVSIKYVPLKDDKPCWQPLSYPLKEAKPLQHQLYHQYQGKPMEREMLKFLKETGNSIYSTELALNERKDKSKERQKIALNEIYSIVKDKNFTSFTEMLGLIQTEYIDKLELDEIPDPSQLKNNCIKIGIKKKLVNLISLVKI